MKLVKGKLPVSVMAIVISMVAFAGLMFTEDLRALTEERETSSGGVGGRMIISHDEQEDTTPALFDPNECRISDGRWVFDSSGGGGPLYSDESCPYLDGQVSCGRNGRPDVDYLHWSWKLDDCVLPEFRPAEVLEKLRGKRLMFVGDSLQRGQWQSFVCMVQGVISPEHKSMNRSRTHSVFTAKEYNATIEFNWAPFLVESNSDDPIIIDQNKRILRVDSVAKHSKHWIGPDFLVFNTYVWWMSGFRIKSLWGSFANDEGGYEEFDATIAYRIGLKTWANWIDSNIDPNTTRVFFTTMSPTHMRSSDWKREGGIRCYNETSPVTERGYWGSGSDRSMMEVVAGVVARMRRVPVTFLNVTQLSEHRIDGHVSVHTESMGRPLTPRQKSNPARYADCIHWCLPGVPDTWNRVLNAYL